MKQQFSVQRQNNTKFSSFQNDQSVPSKPKISFQKNPSAKQINKENQYPDFRSPQNSTQNTRPSSAKSNQIHIKKAQNQKPITPYNNNNIKSQPYISQAFKPQFVPLAGNQSQPIMKNPLANKKVDIAKSPQAVFQSIQFNAQNPLQPRQQNQQQQQCYLPVKIQNQRQNYQQENVLSNNLVQQNQNKEVYEQKYLQSQISDSSLDYSLQESQKLTSYIQNPLLPYTQQTFNTYQSLDNTIQNTLKVLENKDEKIAIWDQKKSSRQPNDLVLKEISKRFGNLRKELKDSESTFSDPIVKKVYEKLRKIPQFYMEQIDLNVPHQHTMCVQRFIEQDIEHQKLLIEIIPQILKQLNYEQGTQLQYFMNATETLLNFYLLELKQQDNSQNNSNNKQQQQVSENLQTVQNLPNLQDVKHDYTNIMKTERILIPQENSEKINDDDNNIVVGNEDYKRDLSMEGKIKEGRDKIMKIEDEVNLRSIKCDKYVLSSNEKKPQESIKRLAIHQNINVNKVVLPTTSRETSLDSQRSNQVFSNNNSYHQLIQHGTRRPGSAQRATKIGDISNDNEFSLLQTINQQIQQSQRFCKNYSNFKRKSFEVHSEETTPKLEKKQQQQEIVSEDCINQQDFKKKSEKVSLQFEKQGTFQMDGNQRQFYSFCLERKLNLPKSHKAQKMSICMLYRDMQAQKIQVSEWDSYVNNAFEQQ